MTKKTKKRGPSRREKELIKAREILSAAGFVPTVWQKIIKGHDITVDETWASDPRFDVTDLKTGASMKSTAENLLKIVDAVVRGDDLP